MVIEKGRGGNLAEDSFKELKHIFDWSINNEDYKSGDVVLIGGWAVHSFNPWKYSLDIDLIATGRFKDKLKEHLHSTRNYGKEKDSTGNTIYLKKLDYGDIYIDFLPKEDSFHGKNQFLDLRKIKYGTVFRNISYSFEPSFQVIVPEISMLLLLKLKAAWDRHYDLSLQTILNREYLNEKFTKDCGDIIALLQSNAFQDARFELLASAFSEFHFLRDFLEKGIIEDNSTFERISHRNRKALIEKLLHLI